MKQKELQLEHNYAVKARFSNPSENTAFVIRAVSLNSAMRLAQNWLDNNIYRDDFTFISVSKLNDNEKR